MDGRTFWDGAGSKKEFTTPLPTWAFDKYLVPSARLLDVGCGYGRTLGELHRRGYRRLFGVDFSRALLKRCRHSVALASAPPLPFRDASFDGVVLLAVLTCIREDDDQRALVAELERVLAPGGVVIANDFILNDDERNVRRYREFESRYGYGTFEIDGGGILRHHRPEWLRELFGALAILEWKEAIFPTLHRHEAKGVQFVAQSNRSITSRAV